MELYVIAGANGCGKTTVLANIVKALELTNAEYICRGFHYVNYCSSKLKTQMAGKDFYNYKIRKAISERRSFIIEDALSKKDVLDVILQSKKDGYRIISCFIMTSSPLVNISRINKRIAQGGHNVGVIKTVIRYYSALFLYRRLISLSDEFFLFDNSASLKIVKYMVDGYWFYENS